MTVTNTTTIASSGMLRLTSSTGPENTPALCIIPAVCTFISVVAHTMINITSAATVRARL